MSNLLEISNNQDFEEGENIVIDVDDEDEDEDKSYQSSDDNSVNNESTFDEFNFNEDDSFLVSDEDDESLESEEEEEEDEDFDNAEFNFEDVKDSIEYIQDRYNFFYKDNVSECNLYLLYIENNSVENVEKIDFELEENGIISKEKIVNLLQDKRIYQNKKYFIKNIWKYGFNLDSDDIINLFDDEESHDSIENLLQPISKLSNIQFDKSINIFKDKNSLFVLYSAEKPERKSSKRKSMKKYVNKASSRRTKKNN